MQKTLTGISSKATGALLAELARAWGAAQGCTVKMESVGGVDAARRVAEDEAFDVVVLDRAQVAKLAAAGKVAAGSERAMVRSLSVAAVRAGTPRPAIATVEDFKAALLAAKSVGFSTGPSGVALVNMIEGWGLKETLQGRLVRAPAGKPVGALIAEGAVELGIQQYSELMNLPGVDILGPLPPGAEIESVFTACVCAAAKSPEDARALVDYFTSADVAEVKRRQGFEPA